MEAKNTTKLFILVRNPMDQRALNKQLASPETLHLRVIVCKRKIPPPDMLTFHFI